MSKPLHSPGPFRVEAWRFGGGTAGFFEGAVRDRDGRDVALVCELGDEETTPEALANARLFAAAPDMLAVLRHIGAAGLLVPESGLDAEIERVVRLATEGTAEPSQQGDLP